MRQCRVWPGRGFTDAITGAFSSAVVQRCVHLIRNSLRPIARRDTGESRNSCGGSELTAPQDHQGPRPLPRRRRRVQGRELFG